MECAHNLFHWDCNHRSERELQTKDASYTGVVRTMSEYNVYVVKLETLKRLFCPLDNTRVWAL